MASWCFNRLLNSGQVTGELVMYLNDDDLLYPEAFETYWNFYQQHDRVPQAMYASQDIGLVDPNGETQIIGRRHADRPGGRACKGRRLDCRVDYLQFCHTAKILDKFRETYNTTQYHSEDKSDAHHAVGMMGVALGFRMILGGVVGFAELIQDFGRVAELEVIDAAVESSAFASAPARAVGVAAANDLGLAVGVHQADVLGGIHGLRDAVVLLVEVPVGLECLGVKEVIVI